MGNNHVKLFEIWTNGTFQEMLFKKSSMDDRWTHDGWNRSQ